MTLNIGPSCSPRAQTDENIATVSATLRGTKNAESIEAFAECIQYITLLEKVMDESRLWRRIR